MSVKVRIKHGSISKDLTLTKDPAVIGRSSTAAVRIEDELLSRNHCAIYLKAGVATVKDLGSKNGTTLNNNTIDEVHFYIGDVIVIGETKIELLRATMEKDELTLHRKSM